MIKKTITIFSIIVFLFSGCAVKNAPDVSSGEGRIVILYTNDEHGWMEATDEYGGAAGLTGLWKNQEGYKENSNYLILSGGDLWTGPAISTWFKGESMVEVMNAMKYDAAAIGNHEFDFKIEGLEQRISQAEFPFLSANIREKVTGIIPDFAIPYIIKNIDGLQVGIIGLTTISAPTSTFPEYVIDYDFIAYADALDEIVPEVKADGAEFLIVIGHICGREMRSLAPKAKSLGISIITGGHCHERVDELVDEVHIIEAGDYMQNYGRVEIIFEKATKEISHITSGIYYNQGGEPDTQIESIIENWSDQLDTQLSKVIGYTENDIQRNSNAMYNMITDSWLVTFPEADVSLINTGGILQDILAGDISLETMVGVLPFENTIFELDMTGRELKDGIQNLVFGGMTMTDGYKFSDGTPIHDDSVYQVLTIDYLYSRPDYNFQDADPEPYQTSVHYRQPVIDWIDSLNTSVSQPLENYLDYNPRR